MLYCVNTVYFRVNVFRDFVLLQSIQQWRKVFLHIKGRSLTSSRTSLSDVRFHELQNSLLVTTIKKSLYLFYIINFIIHYSSVLHFKIHDVNFFFFFFLTQKFLFFFIAFLTGTSQINPSQ